MSEPDLRESTTTTYHVALLLDGERWVRHAEEQYHPGDARRHAEFIAADWGGVSATRIVKRTTTITEEIEP